MAANLLRRCYHLCRTSFPLGLPASTTVAVGGGQGGHAQAWSRPLLALFSTCNHSVQRGRLCAQEEPERLWTESQRVDDLIDNCSTVQELLNLAKAYSIEGKKAARIVIRISYMVAQKKGELDGFLGNSQFRILLNNAAKQVTTFQKRTLLDLFKSFFLLGLEQKTDAFRSVETEVRWRLQQMTCWNLATLVHVMTTHAPKETESPLLSEVLRNLELRWREIDDTRTVLLLLPKAALLSPTLMQQLENKALEMLDQFTLEDIRKVAMVLAHQKKRCVPLLRAISYSLVQKQTDIPPNVIRDLVFAYGKLSFYQNQLFQKFAVDLLPCIPELGPDDVISCIRSFAYLKWVNLPLFEAFGQYVVDNEGRLSPTHLRSIILSFAHLNFQPSNKEAFYGVIHRGLDKQLDTLEPRLKLEQVWSLCILQQASADHLQEVLMPTFNIQFLVNQSPEGKKDLLKLIPVNAAARLESSDYTGPFLPPEILGIKDGREKAEPTALQTTLKETLKGLAGDEAKVCFDVDVLVGWLCDAVMVLDANGNPLPISELVTSDLPQVKPLPPEAKRVAFLRWEFQNFCSQSKDLLGRLAMARRHVQAAGFLVVDVPFYEWHELKTQWQKTIYLKSKMSKVVAEEMAR